MKKTQSEDQEELLRVLRQQQHDTVKLSILNGKALKISLRKAIWMAKAGGHWRWSGSAYRVKQMEMVRPPWAGCYRTEKAPVLPPSLDWVHEIALSR